MRKLFALLLALCLTALLATPVFAALPKGTGVITNSAHVSGSEFSSKSSIAKKLNKMFAGDIGLYVDKKKTTLVDAALGTRNVPNNNVYQYWGPKAYAGTSCYAYANAFYGHFYDGVSPHSTLTGNHQKVKATGTISYANFKKWGVRDDAAVYIREGNHSVVVLHYDENYITYIDGNGDGKGLIALRKEAWKRGSGSNLYNSKPSLIVQPKESYFAAGSMGKKQSKPCSEGGSSHDWDEGKVTKEPTCKEAGKKTYTCEDCGKTKEESVAKTTEHTYGEWSVTKEATCTEKGTKTAACTVCGKEKTKSVKALGHDYGKAVTMQETNIYTPGITEKTCTRCEKVKQTKSLCTFRDKELGITLTAKEKVFSKETRIIALCPGEYEEGLEEQLQSGKFYLYSLDAQKNEEAVTPKGKVTLELKIPEGFGENLALYRLEAETVQVLETVLEDGTITAELESLGLFALCDLDIPYVPETTQPPTEPETEPVTEPETFVTVPLTTAAQPRKAAPAKQPDILLVALLATMPLTASIGVVGYLIIKKRNKNKVTAE